MRQPVMEKVFESDEQLSVRFAMPGSVAKYTCWCSGKTICSYTSSVST